MAGAAALFRRSGEQLDFARGLIICASLAGASLALGQATAIPPILSALVLGMAARTFPVDCLGPSGIIFCSRNLLRIGVTLLGVRLSIAQVTALGWSAVALAAGAVVVTIVLGTFLGRALGLSSSRSVLSAGSVGICGASAAMAISAVLPASREREREAVFTIAAVTTISTGAMLAYPMIARLIGFGDTPAGIFFGASIHDVTQVIGAGALVSPEATVAATATKLVRVACLAPAAILIALALGRTQAAKKRPQVLPPFLIGFVAIAAAANGGLLNAQAVEFMSSSATVCLVAATAALGIKTSPSELLRGGWRPLAAILAQTALIGAYALGGTWWLFGQEP